MRRTILIILAIAVSFCSGFAYKAILSSKADDQTAEIKATGIGGIFFKCKDPGKIREWYKKHLGLNVNQYGAVFEWRQGLDSMKKGFTQWSPFGEKTKYFEPSNKDFMINYRVKNLDLLVVQLKKDSITVTDEVESVEYGKFVHIMDIEGNKVELWEPNDIAYEKLGKQMGSETTK